MSYTFTQGKSIVNTSMKVTLSILLLLVVVQGVQAAGITANFSANRTTGTAPLTVKFTDKSTGSPTGRAWYFGDEKYSSSWTELTTNAGWLYRFQHASVALPDGNIVLMGGYAQNAVFGDDTNDVWRSTDGGATWTEVNVSSPGWRERSLHSAVALPDGHIVLMGGTLSYRYGSISVNDVWRSTDEGATWTEMNASAGWTPRYEQSAVALPDGSIVLMGGNDGNGVTGGVRSDVWRSTDEGATWTEMNASARWAERALHTSVALPDGSIVLMGGSGPGEEWDPGTAGLYNDTWRSTDRGATWTEMNASAPWTARNDIRSVAMPDGSIVLIGGTNGYTTWYRDMWRSTDEGATWTQLPDAGWLPRYDESSVVTPNGSIVLMGGFTNWADGFGYQNDVWRLSTAGSPAKNPLHTYTTPGSYKVSLQAYNAGGYNSMRKPGYITVIARPAVTALSPTKGPTTGNTLVTITGTGFTGATAVKFGTKAGTSKTVVSATKITIRSPAHAAGIVNVTVTTPGGTSAISSADRFTYA